MHEDRAPDPGEVEIEVEVHDGLPLAALAVAVGALAMAPDLLDFLNDDAYITLRYGRNLAAGHGAVMNPGEWVEGFTSPLWMLVAALLHRVSADPVTALVRAGQGCAAAGLVLTALAGRRWFGLGTRSASLAATLLLAHAGFVAWGSSGMETAAAALSTLALAVAVTVAGTVAGGVGAGLAAFLLVLLRPEGMLVGPVALGLGIRDRRVATAGLSTFGCLVALGLALRYRCYGELLPNTFHAKVPLSPDQLVAGLGYLAGAVLAAGLGLLAWLAVKGGRGARSLGVVLGAGLFAVALEGGDIFPLDRFAVPLLPLLVLLSVRGLDRLDLARPRRILAEVGLVAAVFLGTTWPPRLEDALALRRGTEVYEAIGRRLAELEPPGSLVAVHAAGAIPYLTGFPTLDTVGLTDRHIARRPRDPSVLAGHQRGDPDYVLGRRPLLVVPGPIQLEEGGNPDMRDRPYEAIVPRARAFPSERGIWQRREFVEGWEARALLLADGRRVLYFRRR